jgi:UDP-N-acetylmuramyl pentapeptide synthase
MEIKALYKNLSCVLAFQLTLEKYLKNSMFFALKGDNFDGNTLLNQSLSKMAQNTV